MEFDYAKEPGRKLLISNRESDGKPLVSIITPYYNAGKYFKDKLPRVTLQLSIVRRILLFR